MADNNLASRLSVVETELRTIATGHRDLWDSHDKLRTCILNSNTVLRDRMDKGFAKVDADTKSILRWVATGVLGVLLSAVAFLFVRIMGWA